MIQRYIISLLVFPFIIVSCAKEPISQERRFLMNTLINIKVSSDNARHNIKSVINKSFSKMKDIEKLTNRYDKESECASINDLKPGEETLISPRMAIVLKKALALNKITEGAFDVTIAPLVDLWRHYKQKKGGSPSSEEIMRILSKVGSKNMLLDNNRHLRFIQDGAKIDLSGIAKGYAVDEAINVLKENGIENGLVDAGGDIYCLGDGPDKKGWRIGIRHPRQKRLLGTLTLMDRAVATSGDYQNFFFVGNKRYSHILDPRTGYPVSDVPMSVTVVAPDCITADGLATAIMVMGPIQGLRLAEALDNIEAIVVSKEGDEVKIEMTSGIKNFYEAL